MTPSLPSTVSQGYTPPPSLTFDPPFDLAEVIKGAPSDPGAKKAYWENSLNNYVASQGGVAVNDKGQPDPNIAYLQKQVDNAQGDVSSANASKNSSTTAANSANTASHDTAIENEQNRHNKATEGQAHDQYNLSYQLAGIQAEGLALRAKAEQDIANAKGDANKIALARLAYEQASSANTAKLQALKDQVTSLVSIDNTGTTDAVNQANSRNTAALGAANNAASQVTDLTKLGAFSGNGAGAAGAFGGLMRAGAAMSNGTGGAPVPVGQLTDQHKAEITQLVMAGTPFNQAVQQTAARAAQPGTVPQPPGFAAGGGGMGVVGENTGGGGFQVGGY